MLRVAWASCLAATLLISRPLWLTERDYPPVPVLGWLPQPPAPLDWVLFVVMLATLVASAAVPRPRRFIQVALGITALWLVLDQTRWQPYMLTYVIAGVALMMREAAAEWRPLAMAPLQLALACTYLWSGLHKLNYTYLTTEYAYTAGPLFRWLGVDVETVGRGGIAFALVTALVEVAMGIGLLLPRTRRAAVVAALGVHAFILLMLGPLGHGVNAVVWPWNVFTAVAVWALFWPGATSAAFDNARRAWWRALRTRSGTFAARPVAVSWYAVLLLCGVAPALSLVGLWDASLSFQLYAGKQRQVTIGYAPDRMDALPAAARRAVRIEGVVDLTQWSMGEMAVAPVTQPRVVRAIGRLLARRAPDAYIRVIVHGSPDLRTGARPVQEWAFEGPDATPVLMSSVP
ncbi:hypothetical protein [Longimicrobium sp.]|uniref:hypothetical protein n=1 Tax=Longimicrobium sp. TaxID=2029185 RepID=UPI002E31E735|nr:hypothetical protein [Longimicrobium sp.]HEX6038033.1 hypothetical protein [Longimicrobium sp.]